jgi:hypothetical protein
MPEEQKQAKFPSEIVDLPSGGKVYGENSPLKDGKIEIKYMTAKEEDILTSANLIKKGVVIDMLLDSLILSEGVKADDLLLGDKNAVMVAARVLAYGSEYTTVIPNPRGGDEITHTFDLTNCPFRKLPENVDYSKNEFDFELPVTKQKIKFKILTGKEERAIDKDLLALEKSGLSGAITTRLRYSILSIDGNSEASHISNSVNNMLSRDSLALRNELKRISPDIEMEQEIEIEGETVKVNIPMTVNFFWPKT